MDVINEIIQKSALGPLSTWHKGMILSLFVSIVTVLLVMLVLLMLYGPYMSIQFGY